MLDAAPSTKEETDDAVPSSTNGTSGNGTNATANATEVVGSSVATNAMYGTLIEYLKGSP